MTEEKILKELKTINRRLDRAERCYKACCIISVWINNYDPRFETQGELIKQIKDLVGDTLKGTRL